MEVSSDQLLTLKALGVDMVILVYSHKLKSFVLKDAFDRLAATTPGKLFVSLDVENYLQDCDRLGVVRVPQVQVFSSGKLQYRRHNVTDYSTLQSALSNGNHHADQSIRR